MIHQAFIETTGSYSNDKALLNSLWSEIEKNYSSSFRHYHNLNHLNFLLAELSEVRDQLLDWDTVIFSIVYHDVVYRVLKSNNEEKSAEIASKRLNQLKYPRERIDICTQMILATKKHSSSNHSDINFFTDSDLAVLGQDWETYQKYAQGVRKEYSIYPDIIYNPGRKNVLRHFLEMKKIFKTPYFFHAYENQARVNLQQELLSLE
ncbi:MAG TPA: hypothetical protein VGK59_14385 [Ohtaekwangia sp.]